MVLPLELSRSRFFLHSPFLFQLPNRGQNESIFYLELHDMYPLAIPFSRSSVFFSILLSDPPLKNLQITYSLLFSLVVALISDALSAVPDKTSVLCHDASFRQEFQESVSRQPSLNV